MALQVWNRANSAAPLVQSKYPAERRAAAAVTLPESP